MLDSLGLRARLVLLVLAALSPVCLLGMLAAHQQREKAMEFGRSSLLATARLAVTRQEQLLVKTQNLLQAMASGPSIRDTRIRLCEPYLRNLRAQYLMYVNIGVANLEGQLTCHAQNDGEPVNVADRPYFRATVQHKAFSVGEFSIGRATGQPVLNFGFPVYGDDGQLNGVAFAAMEISAMQEALAETPAVAGGTLLVVDRKGVVLAAWPADAAAVGKPAPDAPVREAVRQAAAGLFEGPDAQGLDRIYALAGNASTGGTDLFVVVSEPRDAILGPPTRNFRQALVAVLLAALFGVGFAWWIGGRLVVAPARRMLRVAHRVQRGDLSARVDAVPERHRDELARLGRTLNRMTAAIEERQLRLDEALRAAEKEHALVDLIINSMREGVIAADTQGRFLLFNEAARQVLPLHSTADNLDAWRQWQELRSADGDQAIAPQDRPLSRAIRGESADNLELMVRIDEAPDRVLSLNARPLLDPAGEVVGGLVVFTDITARKAAERLREQQEQVLELIAAGAPLAESLAAVARLVESHSPDSLCTVMLREGERLRVGAAPSLPATFAGQLDGLPVGEQGGACGAAAARGQPVAVLDIEEDALMAAYRPVARMHGLRACWSTPVFSAQGDVVATFAVYHREVHRPDPGEQPLVQAATRLVRIVIERDRAIQALRESEARFRELARTVQDVFYIRDTVAGALLYVSPAYERVWGRSCESAYAQPWSFLAAIHPEDRPGVERDLLRQRMGDNTETEFRVVAPDGTERWVRHHAYPVASESGLVERVVGTARDVTERVLANQRLAWTHRSLEMLSRCNGALVRLSEEPLLLREVCRLAVEVGSYRMAWVGYAQPDGERLVEPVAHAGEEQGYLSAISLSWRDDEPRGRGPVGRALRSGEPVVCEDIAEDSGEFFWRDDAMSRGFRSLVCLPLRHAGAPFGVLSLYGAQAHAVTPEEVRLLQELADNLAFGITTIRERQRARDEVLQLNAGLEQRVQQRTVQLEAANQELEAFSYSVAHDLRAPLAAIDGFSAALERHGLDSERSAHYLGRVRASVQKMGEMIDALLTLARLSRASLRWEAVDLGALASAVVGELQEHEPGRRVQVDIAPGLRAQGDPDLLRLALENLLANAWKFTARQEQAVIAIGQVPGADGRPVFFVRDNGVGFDMAYAGKLFGAFQRLHAAHEFPGTGLGLANVQRIVVRHGGRIWAESAAGAGATFHFTLGARPD